MRRFFQETCIDRLLFVIHETLEEELTILFSFPNVKGALIPTVIAAFVHAASTIGRIKIPTITHAKFSSNIEAARDFCLPMKR
jgi:hypothetical protein